MESWRMKKEEALRRAVRKDAFIGHRKRHHIKKSPRSAGKHGGYIWTNHSLSGPWLVILAYTETKE